MDRISGAYPGGPTRHEEPGHAELDEPPRTIRSGEDQARRAGLRGRDARLRRRRIRAVVGVSVTLLLSAAVGIYWGFSTVRASDELVEWEVGGVNKPDAELSREVGRLIDELWKMEELERLPRR